MAFNAPMIIMKMAANMIHPTHPVVGRSYDDAYSSDVDILSS